MCSEDSDTPENRGDRLDLTNSSSEELDALLLEYEQSRIDIRRYIAQQGQIVTAGIAALAAISGYAVLSSENGYFSSSLVVIIPFVIGLMAIVSMEAENNAILLRKHNTEVQERISEIIDSDDFGYQSRLKSYQTADKIDIGIKISELNWYNVPFILIWGLISAYFLSHILIISLSIFPTFPIDPVLKSGFSMMLILVGYLFVLAIVLFSAYAQLRVRQFRN